jgi:hypothetical protein
VKLQADLHEFLLGGGVHMAVDISAVTAEEIMKTLAPIRYVPEMLEGIREMLEWLVVQDGKTVKLTATANVTMQLRADSVLSPFRLNFVMEPNKDAVQWVLLYHLKHSGLSTDRIQLCSRQECRNIFVLGVHADPERTRYCSIKCSKAAALKAYRGRIKRRRRSSGKQKRAQRRGK